MLSVSQEICSQRVRLVFQNRGKLFEIPVSRTGASITGQYWPRVGCERWWDFPRLPGAVPWAVAV